MRRQRRARPHIRRNIREMDSSDLSVWKVLSFYKFFEGRKAAEQAASEKRIGLEVPIDEKTSNFSLVAEIDTEIPYLQSKVHVRFNAGGGAFVEVFRPLPEDRLRGVIKLPDGRLHEVEIELRDEDGEPEIAVGDPGGSDA